MTSPQTRLIVWDVTETRSFESAWLSLDGQAVTARGRGPTPARH